MGRTRDIETRRTRTLTNGEWSSVVELLTVASRHIRELSDDPLHLHVSRPHSRHLESIAETAETLIDKLK